MRGFVAHRSHRGVDDEKDNEEPRREDRQSNLGGALTVCFVRCCSLIRIAGWVRSDQPSGDAGDAYSYCALYSKKHIFK